MVIVRDIKLELVDAKTKEPFKEHQKNGQTYVEVEPEVEYYVSLQRVAMYTNKHFILYCKVDGKSLGWLKDYPIGAYYNGPDYHGSMNVICQGNVEMREENSLVFAKPKQARNSAECPNGPMLMGKVEFHIYERGVPIRISRKSTSSEMARSGEPTITGNTANDMKQVRSRIGTESHIQTACANQQWTYLDGPFWGVVTLNYCTVPGLIHAGILAKPPNTYEYHRMKARMNKDKPIPPLLVQPQRICEEVVTSSSGTIVSRKPKYYDLFDLTELDDATEDSSGNGANTTTVNTSPNTSNSSCQANRPQIITPDYFSSNKKPRFT